MLCGSCSRRTQHRRRANDACDIFRVEQRQLANVPASGGGHSILGRRANDACDIVRVEQRQLANVPASGGGVLLHLLTGGPEQR